MPERYLGQQIGKYWVTRLLGGGAFAWVYEAVDRDLEIPVALKILRPEFAGQPDAEARFRREAATAARLRHPNIVTVRDVGQVGTASFVAMDLLPLSLARRLELLTRLPEAEVVRIGLGVAAALAVAHAGGVVHRDIKPDNILIGSSGEAVVADFGLASALDSDAGRSAGNQVMGTPHYFSPEQARGLAIDGRTDLYALGVTLFRAATGRLPYEGDDWYAVARQHVEAPIPSARALVPELSVGFDRLLDRLLQKAPEDRFGSALEVADALATLDSAPPSRSLASTSGDAAETVTAFPPVVDAKRTPRQARRPWAAIALGSTLAAVVGWIALQSPTVRESIGTWARSPSTIFRRTAPAVVADSPPTLLADTNRATATPDSASTLPLSLPPVADTNRRPVAAPARTRLTFTAPDSAQLYINGVPVGRGSALFERSGAVRLTLRAVIADAPPDCEAAFRDSTIRLAAGEQSTVTLPVRTCVGVRFAVTPEDAIVRFESLDGGSTVEVRADSAKAVLLPVGRYEVKAKAQGCYDYRNDTLVLTRESDEPSRSRTIKMKCD